MTNTLFVALWGAALFGPALAAAAATRRPGRLVRLALALNAALCAAEMLAFVARGGF